MKPPERRCYSVAVYLHYLDRELNEAAGRYVSERDAIRITRLLCMLTQSELYCGLSAIWENDRLGFRSQEDFRLLFEYNELQTISRDLTLSEFKQSRQSAYGHDIDRYARYFTVAGDALDWLVPTWEKQSGSTAPLVQEMREWTERLPTDDKFRSRPIAIAMRKPLREALDHREDQAVTYSYFKSFLGDLGSSAQAEYSIRRKISQAFTVGNQHHGGGDIVTGIPELQFFDSLAIDFPQHDLRLLAELAAISGLTAIVDPIQTSVDIWAPIVGYRRSQPFRLLGGAIQSTLAALYELGMKQVEDTEQFYSMRQVRARILDRIRTVLGSLAIRDPLVPTRDADALAEQAYMRLKTFTDRLAVEDRSFGIKLGAVRFAVLNERVDVLLVTVNEIETEGLRQALEQAGYYGRLHFGQMNTYWIYGPRRGVTVAHVRSTMGSGGQGGSTLTVADAIRDLDPSAVIAVGVAFGVDEAKQPIGQLLLSQKLSCYELQRVGTGGEDEVRVIPRGSSPESSPRLLGRFRDAGLNGIGISVAVGEVLSGEKLIDNMNFKDALLAMYPEAIGGEMEGAGLQAASGRANVEWLIAKSVCDYAERK